MVTPGGRFSKDTPGIRALATELAGHGKQVLIWDRPNTGASDICFRGASESAMQADMLAGLLVGLGMAPAVLVGGSGGARVSLLTAARHPEVADKVALLWISGGIYGLMLLAVHYCGESIRAAWAGGMEAVAALPEWSEVIERNPGNRQRFLDLDPGEFIETLQRWMAAYCPDAVVNRPRAGRRDVRHPRRTHAGLPERIHRSAPPPGPPPSTWPPSSPVPDWSSLRGGTTNGTRRGEAARSGRGHLFERWPMLVPQLLEFAGSRALTGRRRRTSTGRPWQRPRDPARLGG